MDNDVKIKPVLKWAGGKSRLFKKLKDYLPESYNNYYEPFLGSASVLFNIHPYKGCVNDINSQLINVYLQIKYSIDELIEYLYKYDKEEASKDLYFKNRDLFNNKIQNDINDTECAALMIWINKHCFNGIYRVNSKGLYNVPYNNRTKGPSFNESNLRNISDYLNNSNIQFFNLDFEEFCETVKEHDFVYFDSPYVPMNETGFVTYTKDGFSKDDHIRLYNLYEKLDKIGAYLMLSNNDNKIVREMYNKYNINGIDANRSINRNGNDRKNSGKEVIITNYRCYEKKFCDMAVNI